MGSRMAEGLKWRKGIGKSRNLNCSLYRVGCKKERQKKHAFIFCNNLVIINRYPKLGNNGQEVGIHSGWDHRAPWEFTHTHLNYHNLA